MSGTGTQSGMTLDLDALLAQIAAGHAGRDTVMQAVADLMAAQRPIPLQLEYA